MPNKIKTKDIKEKKWNKKKTVAATVLGVAVLSFIVVIILGVVFQLGPVRPIKSSEADLRTVGEIGGFQVRFEELRYFASVRRQELSESVGDYSELNDSEKAELEEKLREAVLEDICDVYAIFSICEDLDIDANSSEADDFVNSRVEELIEEKFDGDKREYKSWIEEGYLTDSVVRELYRVSYLEEVIIEHLRENKIGIMYDADNVDDFIDYIVNGGDWVRTIHAFYPKESKVTDVSNGLAVAEAAAKELLSISGGDERYAAMVSIIGKAPFVSGFSTTGSGFYFSHGQMGEIYENAAFALEEYGSSEVVETSDGYYVIMRLPIDAEHVSQNRKNLLTNYQYGVLKVYSDAKKQEIAFVGNEYFNEIDLWDLE